MKIYLPPMPKPEDFFLDDDYYCESYKIALAAWKEICEKLINLMNEKKKS